MEEKNAFPLTEEQVMELVDRGLLNAAHELGLQAVKHGNCIETGLDLLHFNATSTEAQGIEGKWFGVAVNVEARVKDPLGNVAVIQHLVNGMGATAKEAIDVATRNWVEGALPPLCHLFGVKHGQTSGTLKLNSYTEGDTQATEWEGFLGPIQFWGDDNLRQAVGAGTPCGLVGQPIMNYLHEKRLHWVKIFGVRYPSGETELTVAIDNEIDPYACSVAESNFDWTPFPNPCSFRQFIVMRPKRSGPVDARLARLMEEHGVAVPSSPTNPEGQPAPKKSRSWFPFKRRSN